MSKQLETLLAEQTIFEPPQSVREGAKLQDYQAVRSRSLADNEGFWAEVAQEFTWHTPWDRVLEFDGIHHQWFVGGQTNITVNALDRHIDAGRGDHTAYIWLAEDGSEQRVTYQEVLARVCRVANGLKAQGVQKGDRVIIYMPLTLEGVICMLACARIGVVHSVVYAGFAAAALRARIEDAGAKLVIAADAGYRRGKAVDLGTIAREAVAPLADVTLVMWQRQGDLQAGDLQAGDVQAGDVQAGEVAFETLYGFHVNIV
jgi:acetyl-CoA synthetase